ncbi:MAG: DNRLRE domain-containing protein, partial [Woeseiaceae bacterium]
MSKRYFSIAMFCLLLFSVASDAVAQSYQAPIADTWLKEAAPNENHGSDKELSAKNKPTDNFRVLYQFDLSSIPANANITRAELRLRVTGEDDSGQQVNIHRVTDSWTENTANWTNTGNDFDPTISASFIPDDTGWVRVDISNLVQSWVCGESSNHGFMLIPTSADKESKYTSKEWDRGNRRPRLYVRTSGTNPCPSSSPPAVIADWQLDDCTLGFAGSSVIDAGPNGLDGITVGGMDVENMGQLCSAGDFDGNTGHIAVPDSSALDVTEGFSIAVWVRHDGAPLKDWEAILAKGDSAYRLHLNGGCTIADSLPGNTRYGFTLGLNGGCSGADLNSNVVPIPGTWYHVAATYDRATMRIYINGNLVNSASYSAPINTNNFDLFIGENSQQNNRNWSGDIDEITIWDDAITPQQVIAHRDRSRPCTNCGGVEFTINHDNFGINCVPEVITIDVVDSMAGTPRTDYNAQITLDTQNGRGTWSLVSGSGAFTDAGADDGLATYTWPLGESTAEFALSYTNGSDTFDIDAYQTSDPATRDDDSEGAISFSPSGFTLTAAVLSNPPPAVIVPFSAAQTAGTDFPIHIAAFGQTPNNPTCGVIESYTGTKNLKFWSGYMDPVAGSRLVDIDTSPVASAEASAGVTPVVFTNGQAVVTGKYKDAGQIQISVKDDSSTDPDLPTGIRGATAGFVARPFEFALSNIEDGAGIPNPVAADANGSAFVAAGEAFSVTVTALDAEGDVTPNYGQETV